MLRIKHGTLHAIDEEGNRTLVGQIDDVVIKVNDTLLTASYAFDAVGSQCRRVTSGFVTLQEDMMRFSLLFHDRRWEGLRQQAKRKGKPGWRFIRTPA